MGNMTTLQILQGVHDWVLDKIDEETANFITKTVNDLVNYYTKSETYTKAEVQQIVDAIKQFTYEVVQVLPTASASTMNKIYLVPAPKSEDKNVKEEYITIQDGSTYSWEMLGTTSIDLSNYYTKGQTNSAISSALSSALASYTTTADLTTLLAQKQDVIQDLADIRSGASAGSTAVQPSTLNNAVKNVVAESGVYDVSANNDNTKFESLSALLSSANLNTLIPEDIRKGGMSIKFIQGTVQSSDNNYVRYNLIADEFTTDVTKWAIDDNGIYIHNSDFLEVETDSEGKILWGVKKDGDFYFGAGCPQQVVDYVLAHKTEILAALATKVDKEDGKSLIDADVASSQSFAHDTKYLEATIDSENKILEGITQEGRKEINVPIDTPSASFESAANNSWIDVLTDKEGKLLQGFNNKGEVIWGTMPPQIIELLNKCVKIENPYKDLDVRQRHLAISHEHSLYQYTLEKIINRGIDVICISNYEPSVPFMPLDGFTREYEDWEFELDGNGNIVYETDEGGNIKTKTVNGVVYKIPVLNRVTKSYSNGYSDFTKQDGTECDLTEVVQLPNCEHAGFILNNGTVNGAFHLNYIGSNWGDAVNAALEHLDKYNEDNGTSIRSGTFRNIFPLWTLAEEVANVKNNLLFNGKCFGTINHPGYSSLSQSLIDEAIETGNGVFKAMEIYNHTSSDSQREQAMQIYDTALLRGHKLWCLAVNDWGKSSQRPEDYPEQRGANLLYIDSSYSNKTVTEKAEMALDAYIDGCFSAVGYGTIDLKAVSVFNNTVKVSFNEVADRIVIDIDGNKTTLYNTDVASSTLTFFNKFVRFEAYKGDDFIFTQPFYVK